MSIHRKDKMGILDGFEELKGHTVGAAQAVSYFGLNIGNLEFTGAFSWKKLVNYCL